MTGFGFVGDANASFGTWTTALNEIPECRRTFGEIAFIYSRYGKKGDLMIGGTGIKGCRFFDNACAIPSREPSQHECMIMEWCYAPESEAEPSAVRPQREAVPLPRTSPGPPLPGPPESEPEQEYTWPLEDLLRPDEISEDEEDDGGQEEEDEEGFET